MKKKILSLILCLMICVSVFAGCNLVTRNDQKYYEAIVCTISYKDGTQDAITKRDLLMGYNSYGYNYEQNYGYSRKQAMETTLETIVNQHLTIKAVENYYNTLNNGKVEGDEGFEPLLNGSETTYLYDITYDAIYENLKSYFSDIVGISYGQDEQASANASVFQQYERKAELMEDSNGKLVIVKNSSATTIRDTYETNKENFRNFEEASFKELMYNKILSLSEGNSLSAKNWKSAFNKYISDVKSNYSYKKFASDKECFMFEMDRVYNILKDNYLVEKYETIYNNSQYRDDKLSNVTVDDILKYYSAKVRADYTTYKTNGKVSDFESNILSDFANVDYILEDTDANYFNVAYIKLEMTEQQKSDLAELKENANLSETQRKIEIDKIYGAISATVRNSETGEKTSQTVGAQALLNSVRQDVADAGVYVGDEILDKETARDKAAAFRKYLYLYNDDDSLKGAEYNAVFGVRENGEVLAGSTFSGNEEAENAIKALYNEGKVGATSEIVKADDGLYIFFFAGKIENLFDVGENFDASLREENILKLASTRLNIFSEKTIFDSIFETLTTDNFSVFQNMNMQNLRSNLVESEGIEFFTNNLKDLY